MTGDFRQFPANKMASFLKPNVITIFSWSKSILSLKSFSKNSL
jgi:hypothetical protein